MRCSTQTPQSVMPSRNMRLHKDGATQHLQEMTEARTCCMAWLPVMAPRECTYGSLCSSACKMPNVHQRLTSLETTDGCQVRIYDAEPAGTSLRSFSNWFAWLHLSAYAQGALQARCTNLLMLATAQPIAASASEFMVR